MAGELVRAKIAVIAATDTVAAQVAKQTTNKLPIVVIGAGDPVGSGLIASFARPGGNVTGSASAFDDGIAGKWVELLHEVRPVSKVGVVWNSAAPSAAPRLYEIERAAGVIGVTIQPLALGRPEELQAVIDVLRRGVVEGLIVDADATLYTYQPQIIAAARLHRIPTVFAWPRPVEDGGLLGYGASVPEMYRLAAVYVDKIARGANPADLPVERVSRFHLARPHDPSIGAAAGGSGHRVTPPYLLPYVRVELLLHAILTTRWDAATWPIVRRHLPRVLERGYEGVRGEGRGESVWGRAHARRWLKVKRKDWTVGEHLSPPPPMAHLSRSNPPGDQRP
jgi:hypothetical protein